MHKEKVIQQFNRMEETRNQLFSLLKSVDEQTFYLKPKERKWNIAQIIFHLNSSESRAVSYISKKMLGGTAVPKSSFLSQLKSLALTAALRYTKFKKPPTLPDPPETLIASEIMYEWSETRDRMKELIDRVSDDMVSREIFRHPYAGRMNMKQALTFMQEHFDHHEKQIMAIMKKSENH